MPVLFTKEALMNLAEINSMSPLSGIGSYSFSNGSHPTLTGKRIFSLMGQLRQKSMFWTEF